MGVLIKGSAYLLLLNRRSRVVFGMATVLAAHAEHHEQHHDGTHQCDDDRSQAGCRNIQYSDRDNRPNRDQAARQHEEEMFLRH